VFLLPERLSFVLFWGFIFEFVRMMNGFESQTGNNYAGEIIDGEYDNADFESVMKPENLRHCIGGLHPDDVTVLSFRLFSALHC
jgi:hypothetical protein